MGFWSHAHGNVVWKKWSYLEKKKFWHCSVKVPLEIQIKSTPSSFLSKDELNRPHFSCEMNFQLVKSELLDMEAQTSDVYKSRDNFLQVIYFTVSTSLLTFTWKTCPEVNPITSLKSKVPLIIIYFRIKAYVRTVIIRIYNQHSLLSLVTCLPAYHSLDRV